MLVSGDTPAAKWIICEWAIAVVHSSLTLFGWDVSHAETIL
jgi:hypothetical protein